MDSILQPDASYVLGVSDLTKKIKSILEGKFNQVWVQGEVSNLRAQSSGHIYFSLKDSNSQLPCVLFARDAARQNFDLEDGMEVLLLGAISVYQPHGRYQLITKIVIKSGEGKLQLKYEKIKRQLAGEGLFDSNRKQALPILPQKIGVITSPTGAAVRDFIKILKRRNFFGKITIIPARVQGKEAPGELVKMLKSKMVQDSKFDLMVLTRGGGSIEDLWAFNDETVVRAISNCPVPTISAVGHEIDTVLSDYAADIRAETPSGAAELISSIQLETTQRIQKNAENINDLIQNYLYFKTQFLHQLHSRMRFLAPARQVELTSMRLDDLDTRLKVGLKSHWQSNQTLLLEINNQLQEHHPKNSLRSAKQSIQVAQSRLNLSTKVSVRQLVERLHYNASRLQNSSLRATLKRGYAVLRKDEGSLITSARAAHRCSTVSATFHDGSIELEVKKRK
ncbi:MAG: exodeoxyribonuclease VII large subunit [Verrucomicrobiota bacterium]|nr:exodeoxyribonuclease VII large subunit [Verrucomicrobiota bacterium]